MINVYVYPADLFGCGYYRVIWPALALDPEPDLMIHVVPPGDPSGLTALMNHRTGRLETIAVPPDADVIVLQRPTNPQLAQSVEMLRARGVAVVIDIDDDLTSVHPDNPAWAMMHPNGPYRHKHNWESVTLACRNATMVTVSSEALTRRYGRGNTVFIPNYVPSDFLDVPHEDNTVVGWAGSTHSHPNDLGVMGTAVRQLLDTGERFMIVGDGTGAGKKLNLGHDPAYTGPIEFGQWPSAVTQIGVGVAPLADTKFNAAKSWLKPLEYSAVGVPWIASPRAEYARLHRLGAGMLADRPKEWYAKMLLLIEDEKRRADLSAAGREVARTLTYDQHAHLYAEVWKDAYEMERVSSTTQAHSLGIVPGSR